MRNRGKVFEADFQASCPPSCWMYRLRDGSAAWDKECKSDGRTRFQTTNIGDFLLHDDETGNLAILEMKSIGKSSLPFADIRYKNLSAMVAIVADRKRMTSWMVINYRKSCLTVAVPATAVKTYIDTADRRSIPVEWAVDNGVIIPQQIKKVHYRYDYSPLLAVM